jgi:uncharacterized protein (TIGR02118 family)
MLKLFDLWNRNPDMTRGEALRSCVDTYAPVVVSTMGNEVARYVTNVGLTGNYQGRADEAPPYDGIDEYWLSTDSFRAAPNDTIECREHQRAFMGTRQLMLAAPRVHLDRGRQHLGIKSMFLLTRRPEMTHDDAMVYWHEQHVPLVMKTLGDTLIRYSTNVGLTCDFRGWPNEAPPYDGVAELWLDLSIEEMFEFVDRAANVLLPDEQAFLGSYRMVLVDEQVHAGSPEGRLPR